VAVLQAVATAFGIALSPRKLTLLAREVETQVAGAACGVMGQMTAACSSAGRLLVLLCQPAELRDAIALPEDWRSRASTRESATPSRARTTLPRASGPSCAIA
jgi:galactokinase